MIRCRPTPNAYEANRLSTKRMTLQRSAHLQNRKALLHLIDLVTTTNTTCT